MKYLRLCIMACVVSVVLVLSSCDKKEVRVSDYIKVKCEGYSGYATLDTQLDSDKLQKALIDEGVLDKSGAKSFVDSIELDVKRDMISNGENLIIKISCDKNAVKDRKVLVKDISYKVSGLKEPKVVDVFASLDVKIEGISPKVKLNITNNSTDEYIKNLKIVTDKQGFLKIDDEVTVKVEVDDVAEGKKGMKIKQKEQKYVIGKMSSYPQTASELIMTEISNIDALNIETIKKETGDTTKHMLWRITGEPKYLLSGSSESVKTLEKVNAYLLSEKVLEEGKDNNYIYFIYRAEITNGSQSETGFFLFEYKNAVISGGKLLVGTSKPEERYVCSKEYEKIYSEYIGNKENIYNIYEINNVKN